MLPRSSFACVPLLITHVGLFQPLESPSPLAAKANCGEFALAPSESVGSVYGSVRNPYNLDYTPAGAPFPLSSATCTAGLLMQSLVIRSLILITGFNASRRAMQNWLKGALGCNKGA